MILTEQQDGKEKDEKEETIDELHCVVEVE
jgi:hypothetical protein